MICALCDKRRMVGNKRSHSNIKTKRVQKGNIQRIRVQVGGTVCRLQVCTSCIASGYVQKPVARTASV